MASDALFNEIPSFPDDVPVAAMRNIPLSGLLSGDVETAQLLLAACQTLGFFFLDLNEDPLGRTMIGEVDQLFRITRALMELPDEVKQNFRSSRENVWG